ncbi:MAG: B12-binding domain-containing protein, partial [Proteobacteria bacterium]|nr:B12-binding domain-containing protein [Pseudomonadota bacterium]
MGGAVIVMAFDEQGQASTTERRVEILTRAVGLLTQKLGFRYCDIALDPNILAIGTGLEEHRKQALSFIETCRIMRRQFPGILTAGGLSNLSFAFRGRDDVRSAIHRVFLELARDALSLVIANPAMLKADVPEELRALAYALVTDESDHALEDLLSWMQVNQPVKNSASASTAQPQQAEAPADRLREAFVLGGACEAQALPAVRELRQTLAPLQIIEGPLMAAMNEVGERFGRGDMYLPQIVKAARLMKQCIDALDIAENQRETTGARRKILLATVRGDVHDIGKNIVSIVLTCNG